MTALTYPWSVDADAAIRGNVRVVTEVEATHPDWAAPIPLEVTSGAVSFDEQWSPHVRADLTCKVPADPDQFAALDPRDLVRIVIRAGYVYPGGQRDVHLLADLGLRARVVARPGSTLRLMAVSDEILIQDAGGSLEFVADPGWALNDMLTARLPATLGFTPDMDLTECPSTPVPVTFASALDQWQVFKGACDVAAAWLRDRGDRTLVVSPWPTEASQPVHTLQGGPAGTVIDSEVSLTRDEWSNTVSVTYTTDTGESVTGWAYITGPRQGITSPTGSPLPGLALYQETRAGVASTSQANAAAAAILRRRLRAGRTATVNARSAFWVRPGTTVALRAPNSDQERHLVARTVFDLARGEMTVTTREPDSTTILTGA